MHQQLSFHEFDRSKTEHRGWTPGKRIGLGLLLILTLAAAAAAGYALGRGTVVIPNSLSSFIPAPLAAWLPQPSGSQPPTVLSDYGFELVEGEAKQGEALLAVRLVSKASGKAVPDAVIFARRLDMAPEGMPTMTSTLEPQPSYQPGVYRFKTDLTMEGGWQLSLAAKVEGEPGTVQGKLVLKAVP